jgi:hypothetical protein
MRDTLTRKHYRLGQRYRWRRYHSAARWEKRRKWIIKSFFGDIYQSNSLGMPEVW